MLFCCRTFLFFWLKINTFFVNVQLFDHKIYINKHFAKNGQSKSNRKSYYIQLNHQMSPDETEKWRGVTERKRKFFFNNNK